MLSNMDPRYERALLSGLGGIRPSPNAPPIMSATGVRPSPNAPPIMSATGVRPSPNAPPIMSATGAQAAPPALPDNLRIRSGNLTFDYDQLNDYLHGDLAQRMLDQLESGVNLPGSYLSTAMQADLDGFSNRQGPGGVTGRRNPAATQNYVFNPFVLDLQNETPGRFFETNKGNRADLDGASGFVPFDPNFQYRLRSGGDELYSGSGFDALKAVTEQARRMSYDQGGDAAWEVEYYDPSADRWVVGARDKKDTGGLLGTLADIALPIAGGILLPGVGGVLGGALGSALGAGAGSLASSALQGRSLENALLRGALTAGTAGLVSGTGLDSAIGGALSGGGGGATGGAAGSAAGGTAGSALGSTASNIIVPGVVNSGLSGAISGGIGAGVGSLGGSLINVGGGLPSSNASDITVVGQQPPTDPLGGIIAGGAAGAIGGGAQPNPVDATDIVVEAERPVEVTGPGSVPIPTPTIPTGPVDPLPDISDPASGAEGEEGGMDIIDYIRAAGLGLGLIDGLFGGRGSGNNTIPAGLFGGGLGGVFNASLPEPTVSSNFAVRDDMRQRPRDDWYRYGYGPEQSFFTNIPEGSPNTSTAFTGYARGGEVEHGGGSAFAVRGQSGGRSDDVPAMLSEGEHVIDAETVALLGDGSSDAGHRLLEDFKVKVRKHKGRKLAKGDFSVKAKSPEQYMYGARA